MTQTDDADPQEHGRLPSVSEVEDSLPLELAEAGSHVHKPDWRIFLPTAVILTLYGAGAAMMWRAGWDGSELFRLFVIVLALGVPLIAAHAFLRYETARVQVLPDRIRYHPGWPKDVPLDIPRELILRLAVKRGFAGLVFGGGTLVIETTAGTRVAIADLADPQKVVREYDGQQ